LSKILPVDDLEDDLDLPREDWELDRDLDRPLCDPLDLLDLGPLDLVRRLPDPDLEVDLPREPPLPPPLPAPLLRDLPRAGESPRDLLLDLPPGAGAAGVREADLPRFPRDCERDLVLDPLLGLLGR